MKIRRKYCKGNVFVQQGKNNRLVNERLARLVSELTATLLLKIINENGKSKDLVF